MLQYVKPPSPSLGKHGEAERSTGGALGGLGEMREGALTVRYGPAPSLTHKLHLIFV